MDLVTLDLSFISLALILSVLRPFLKPKSTIICLIKPQFEVGRTQVEKGGLVTDPRKHQQVIDKITSAVCAEAYSIDGVIESPILGAEGNKEFLMGLRAAK